MVTAFRALPRNGFCGSYRRNSELLQYDDDAFLSILLQGALHLTLI
jgi:hypothetical protein